MDLPASVSQRLSRLVESVGSPLSPEEFWRQVNVTYHDNEAGVYDANHTPMWKSLPRVYRALIEAAEPVLSGARQIAVLDVGCGTGLASEMLLENGWGGRIASIDFADTSPQMLQTCRKRTASWSVPRQFHCGEIKEVPHEKTYDVIVANSLLHHIPDLPAFFEHIERLLGPGGVFIHAQDPNADYEDDPKREARREELQAYMYPVGLRRYHPVRLAKRVVERIFREEESTLTEEVNSALLEAGVVRRPMTSRELWAVTDIHVPSEVADGLGRVGDGISYAYLCDSLEGLEPVAFRSYAYFEKMHSLLPSRFKAREESLFEQRDSRGFQFGAVWSRRGI